MSVQIFSFWMNPPRVETLPKQIQIVSASSGRLRSEGKTIILITQQAARDHRTKRSDNRIPCNAPWPDDRHRSNRREPRPPNWQSCGPGRKVCCVVETKTLPAPALSFWISKGLRRR